jgi:hypothetical protein
MTQGDLQVRGGQEHQANKAEILYAGSSAEFGPKQRIAQGKRRRFEEVHESRQRDLLMGIGEAASVTDVFAEQSIDRGTLATQFQHYVGQDVRADGRCTDLLSHHFTFFSVPASGNESSFTV